MESDEEWSMNKKLIDLSSKDVRKSVSIEACPLKHKTSFVHVSIFKNCFYCSCKPGF